METFGELLKRHRLARLLSQVKVAERADYSHSYISRLEAGLVLPSRVAVDRLAVALNLDGQERPDLFVAAGLQPDKSGCAKANGAALWPTLAHPLLRELDALLAAELPAERKRQMVRGLRWMVTNARRSVSVCPERVEGEERIA